MIAPEKIIYLDNNATTRVDPAVLEEMLPFLTTYYGNPSSGYQFGAQVRDAIELARERVAALLGCLPARNRLHQRRHGIEQHRAQFRVAARSGAAAHRHHARWSTAPSASIAKQLAKARGRGDISSAWMRDGNLDLDELEHAIRPETALVSVMWANNETGVLFPVEKIAAIAREKRVLFHTDAVQAVGQNSDSPAPIRRSISLALRAQVAWPERRRRALRQSALALSALDLWRQPGRTGGAPARRTWPRSWASGKRRRWRPRNWTKSAKPRARAARSI